MKSSWTRSVVAGGILLFGGALSGGAYALDGTDITLRPYAHSGFQLYDLSVDFKYPDGSVVTVNDESNYLFLGAGATALLKEFYLDFNFSTSLAAELDGDSGDLDRKDFSIAVGYMLPNGFTTFGGFTNGNTDFDSNGIKTEFEADGLFGGGSYKWSVNDKIQFNVYAAIAFLNGTYKYRDRIDYFSTDGDTTGVSFGFSASTMITEDISVTGFIKTQSYIYDDFEGLPPGFGLEIEETLTTLGINVGMVL